jgi:hypothetical protein
MCNRCIRWYANKVCSIGFIIGNLKIERRNRRKKKRLDFIFIQVIVPCDLTSNNKGECGAVAIRNIFMR